MSTNSFEKILSDVVLTQGIEILSDKRLICFLMDYHAFDEVPALKRIIKDLIDDNLGHRLLALKGNNSAIQLEINKYRNTLIRQYGYSEAIVEKVLGSIYAIFDPTTTENSSLTEKSYNIKLQNQEHILSSTSHTLTPDMVNKNVKEFIVSEGIIEIGESAFENHERLEKVKLPSTLRKIDKFAFYGCTALKSLELPKGLIDIEDYAFYGSAIKVFDIPASVKKLGDCLFGGASYSSTERCLERVLFHSPSINVATRTFWGCYFEVGIPRGRKDEFMSLIRQRSIMPNVDQIAYFD